MSSAEAEYEGRERTAYLDGARDGRIAGFCWGVMLGLMFAAAAFGVRA